MTAIDEALEDLRSHNLHGQIPYQRVAEKHGVVASTLRRRFLAKTESREVKHLRQQLLTPEQEAVLIQWVNNETQGRQPPAAPLVAQKASILAGKDVGNGWVYRFLKRHEDTLVYKRAAPMDRQRAEANSYENYHAYFTYLESKLQEYQVPADQTYNMDEKGFAMGKMNATKRVFSRPLFEQKTVRAPLQDGSTEWITVLACICADGTAIPPALIYQSDAAQVWSTWVEDIKQDQPVFVTASKSGWTNNDIGLQWLIQVFDRETKAKARRSWRLLYVDGHASHVTLEFLKYCAEQKILLAQFPAHATHELQPLDVVVFKSLSSAYNRELEQFRDDSHGRLPLAKRDFFTLFWRAWSSTIQPPLVLNAFRATGLHPFNPEVILQKFAPEVQDPGSDSSGSHLDSWNQLNRRFKKVVKDINDPKTQHLHLALHHAIAFSEIYQHQVNRLEQALETKKKRRKPGKALRDSDIDRGTGGSRFWSPRSIGEEELRIKAIQAEEAAEELRKIEAAAEKLRQKDIKAREAEVLAEQRRVAKAERQAQEQERQQHVAHRKFLREYKKMAEQCRLSTQSQARTRAPKSKASGGRGGRRKVGGRAKGPVPARPPPPPPTNSRGRNIKTPARYR
jgi:hypothetical protein